MNLRAKYSEELRQLENLPDSNRAMAEQRFLLLREFEECYAVAEKQRLGKKYHVHPARKRFCQEKGISKSSFLRWRKAESDFGIMGLVPLYGLQRAENKERFFCFDKQHRTRKRVNSTLTMVVRFNANRPLDCIRVVADLVNTKSDLPEKDKLTALFPLNFILSFPKPYYFKPQILSIGPEDLKQLKIYVAHTHRNHWAKAKVLLMAHAGHSLFEISIAVGRPRATICRWLRLYKEKGLDFIETRLAEVQRKIMWEERATKIIDILHSPPATYGINRTSWTYDTILQVFEAKYHEPLPKSSLKRIIKETNYTWRHARQVLTSHDPDYQKKVMVVLDTLRQTKEDEAFFFVDEFGPYQVKKYGGKSLNSNREIREAPDKQASKGKVQAIAALEAFTNQMTWRFIENKDVDAIISIFEMLNKKYSHKKVLFLTWDAISTHNAAAVKSWIENHNEAVAKAFSGPKFVIVPLPSKSQFLNVIESVFSGMNKAVIHNSDYPSKEAMETAIDRHFVERNEFYRKNPKRAGNKIWDKESFDTKKLHGGLFKKM